MGAPAVRSSPGAAGARPRKAGVERRAELARPGEVVPGKDGVFAGAPRGAGVQLGVQRGNGNMLCVCGEGGRGSWILGGIC